MPFAAGIHYTHHSSGIPDRPPLILLHGAGGNLLTWHPHLRRLAGETVYALDLPGHGGSQGEGRSSIQAYAEDVLRFMDAENIHNAVLGGISMGSAITLTLALTAPRRVTKMVLIGGGAKMRVAPAVIEGANDPQQFAATVDVINTNCFSPHADPELLRLSKEHMLKIPPGVLHGDFLACDQFDITAHVSEIRTPALILCGTLDKMMPPKFSQSLSEALPNNRLHLIEDAGHMPQLEKADEAAQLIQRFLDEPPPPTAG